MNKYYNSLSYAETAQRLTAIQDWIKSNPSGAHYDERMKEQFPDMSDKYLDELMVNILSHFYHCGTPDYKMPRGHMNVMIIQCALIDVLGGDFGKTPVRWTMNMYERILLLSTIPMEYIPFDDRGHMIGEVIATTEGESS
jgi:hypothetical protein